MYGTVLRLSEVQSQDMTYNGSMNTLIQQLASAPSKNRVALIPAMPYWEPQNEDTEVRLFQYDFLQLKKRIPLGSFLADFNFASHGRFLFYNRDASNLFVVVQTDPSSGLLDDFGVVVLDTTEIEK